MAVLIDLGLVDGNYWNASHVDAIEAAINSSSPAGMVVMSIAAAAPSGWLLLAGQVVTNAQTLYPALWAVAPAAWKSGASLNLPNATTRFPIGQDATHAIGAVGGSSTRTLTQGNLPPHTHNFGSSTGMVGIDPGTSQQYAHNHVVVGAGSIVADGAPGGYANAQLPLGGSSYSLKQLGSSVADHKHTIPTGPTDNGPGTSDPISAEPAWIAVTFMIRAY
jgi:microcystin-dependent protein